MEAVWNEHEIRESAEAPHVAGRPAVFADICSAIDGHLRSKDVVVVAIDGRCGAGKTALAQRIEARFLCTVIHMDDFFLPRVLRHEARLREPGGTIHYERFFEEVVMGIRSGAPFTYRKFDCGTMAYRETVEASPSPVMLCEGTYSLHPRYQDMYDLKLFAACSGKTQRERLLHRNGEGAATRFFSRWIPLEEQYFKVCDVEAQCHLLWHTDGPNGRR